MGVRFFEVVSNDMEFKLQFNQADLLQNILYPE